MDPLTSQYRRIYPPMRTGETALVVIDMNDHYLIDGRASTDPAQNYQRAEAAIKYFSQQFRERNPDIVQVWVADTGMVPLESESPDSPKKRSHDKLRQFTREDFQRGYSEFEEFQKSEDALFLKVTTNAFDQAEGNVWDVDTKKDLVTYLREKGVTNILVSGARLSECIPDSIMGAVKAGFNVVPIEAAMTGCYHGQYLQDSMDDLHRVTGLNVYPCSYVLSSFGIDPEPLEAMLDEIYQSLPRPPKSPGILQRLGAKLGLGS